MADRTAFTNGLTYRDVAHKLHIATETVSRGARELMDPRGGFSQLLNHDKDKSFKNHPDRGGLALNLRSEFDVHIIDCTSAIGHHSPLLAGFFVL